MALFGRGGFSGERLRSDVVQHQERWGARSLDAPRGVPGTTRPKMEYVRFHILPRKQCAKMLTFHFSWEQMDRLQAAMEDSTLWPS